MKKIKAIIAILSSAIITSSLAVSLSSSAAKKELPITHCPQKTNYYCGPASLSQLSSNWKITIWKGNTSYWEYKQRTEDEFAKDLNMKGTNGAAWYVGNNSSSMITNQEKYPFRVVLNKYKSIHRHTYQINRKDGKLNGSFDKNNVFNKIKTTINSNNAIILNGDTYGKNVLIDDYPAQVGNGGHYITIIGYSDDNGKKRVKISEPAIGSPAISALKNSKLPKQFYTDIDRLITYTKGGMVY